MPDLTIKYVETEFKGRYRATIKGIEGAGELIVKKVTPTLIIADHTEVPETMAGHGVARALVERLIADAREKGQRIVAFCPYVRAYAQKHAAEVSDAFQW
ncbi:GNAT family N-acetyltransferase [Sulfitobacter sp. F26169L]|uniref:GNAT family N-acetyltransferase n=1 Tax=Sulfitobacter sp. F26169L TaxID=2996015 RepID=UPI002260B38C|nr:GNAT family N-acetyltransferase [Sulfitobacter sp. F26169L]MCX7564999.1 GNAT family N-acetyltransferase [Sulfitobacter sp. F26169L]